MQKFNDRIKQMLDYGNDVYISTNNNGYVGIIKHEYEHHGSITIIDYNENRDTIDEVNVGIDTFNKFFAQTQS
jgi:hypothetical protein